jgi:hypothetical protein
MLLHLKIIGWILLVLSLIHIAFPRYFKWKIDLHGLALINKEMMYVHTFFIALVVLLMGVLCVTSAHEMLGTELGHRLSLGLFIFWDTRLLIQHFGYSAALWKGKAFEFIIHVCFSLLWLYFSVVFFMVWWMP